MADPPPSTQAAPSPSYARVVASSSTPTISIPPLQHGVYKGEPSIILPSNTEQTLALPFQNALVGKFSQGKPRIDAIQKFLSIQNYKGEFSFGFLDHKHVIFRFMHKDDYIRLFSKPSWIVGKNPMRMFKWSIDFHVDRESSIVPVWISLPKLPIHLTNKDFIFDLMKPIGNPLRLDKATAELRRPSLARVQVEVDILSDIPTRIWIQKENGDGFWQSAIKEGLKPAYCSHCWHRGHTSNNCIVKNPALAPKGKHIDKPKTQNYVPKANNDVPEKISKAPPSIDKEKEQPLLDDQPFVEKNADKNEIDKNGIDKNEIGEKPFEDLEKKSNDPPLQNETIYQETVIVNPVEEQSKKTPEPSFKEQLTKSCEESTMVVHKELLRPIIHDKNSPLLNKHRFLENAGMSSDSEKNKARMDLKHSEFFEDQENDQEDDENYYTEKEDTTEDQELFGDEPPLINQARRSSLRVQTRGNKTTKHRYDDFYMFY